MQGQGGVLGAQGVQLQLQKTRAVATPFVSGPGRSGLECGL